MNPTDELRIVQLKTEIKELDDIIKTHEKHLGNLMNIRGIKIREQWDLESKFTCPLGKNNHDALCPECEHVLVKYCEDYDEEDSTGWGRPMFVTYYGPFGMDKHFLETIKKNMKGCREWVKKKEEMANGYGSTTCICGYEGWGFGGRIACPLCGRTLLKHKNHNPR